jgi:hypothetical protein
MPSNALILGMPRSGTSMVTGLFSNSGFFLGDNLLPPSISNPKGYFEDRDINDINNYIVHRQLKWEHFDTFRKMVCPKAHRDKRLFPSAAPKHIKEVIIESAIKEKIIEKLRNQPFLFKDPRFCLTLPYWKPLLPEHVKFVIVFRDPFRTAESYILNGHNIYGLKIPIYWPFYSYHVNYSRIISWFKNSDNAIFIHYEQIFVKNRIDTLGRFLGVNKINESHPTKMLSRSKGNIKISEKRTTLAVDTYNQLCLLSQYSE